MERYMISRSLHKRHIEKDDFCTRRHSDLIMVIVKVIDDYNPNLDKTVLIFEIKSSCHWLECGKGALIRHIGHQADVAFSELRTAREKVYLIGAIGPLWIDLWRNTGRAGSEAAHRVVCCYSRRGIQLRLF